MYTFILYEKVFFYHLNIEMIVQPKAFNQAFSF